AATVSVEDTIFPIALCQNVTVYLNNIGSGVTNAAAANNGSSDNCLIASITLSQSAFYCAEVGSNLEVLTVTDANGNSTSCNLTVTVIDTVAPTAICQNVTVQLDGNGNGSILPSAVNNGSNDACGIQSVTLSQSSFVCAEVGTNTEVLTVTDVNGNSTTCTTIITVEDTVAPIALCTNVVVQLDATGNGTTTAAAVNNGSNDACGIQSLILSQTAFVCAEVGANTEVLTVTDVNGNSATCTTIINVQDNVAPVAVCQNITVQLDPSGNASITASQVNNGSSDACGIQSLSLNQSAFLCQNVGPNTILLTVTDVNGNAATCTSIVLVEDTVAPVAVCQNVTIQLDNAGNGNTTVSAVNSGSNDACGIQSLSLSQTAFGCSEVGANSEVLTVTDVNGNSSTCTALITVEDNVAPVAVCQNITVQLNPSGNVSVTASQVGGASNDACGIASLALDITNFTCANVNGNLVVLTVTDVNGNSSTCLANVTVEDTVAPVAVCQNVTVQLDNAGNGSTTAAAVNGGSLDNCGLATVSLSQTTFNCTEVGANTEVLTVTDVYGNATTCITTITVEDNVAPAAICQNLTVQLDNQGNANITPVQVNNGSTDACGVANLALDITSFNCANVNGNTVVLTVTDVNGNTGTCTSVVNVLDTIAPQAICQNITVQLDNLGNGVTTAAAINNGSTDACGIANLSISMGSFNCANVGANTVFLTATDLNGNTNTCAATVTVLDTVAPAAICQNITVQLNGAGTGTAVAAAINNGSADACGIGSLSLNVTSFACANVGANNVVLTVTDVNGNSSTCAATVFVQDTVPPTAICQNVTVQLNAAGIGIIAPASVNNGSSDACGLQTLSFFLTQNSFGCSEVGANTEILTVTDVNGNTGSCTTIVTVQDNIAPVAICQNLTLQLDSIGNATVAAVAVNNGSSDACGITSLGLNLTAFNCNNVGPNTVILTVTDVNGNSSSCSAVVTVQDTVDPVALCHSAVVILDANGAGTVNHGMVDHGSTDACGIFTQSLNITNFTCANLGSNTVILTVLDVNGNSDTCWATVIVRDSVTPTLACPANISLVADSSICGAIATWTTPIATDNCSGVTLTSSHASGSIFPDGVTTVTYTATDSSGNATSCAFTVSVSLDPLVVTVGSTLQGCGYHLRCAGDLNGSANTTVSGGCLPYQYLWSTGATTDNIFGLGAGTYFVTVTDARNQVAIDTIVITAPAPLSVAIVGDTLVCHGAFAGSLQAIVTGGQTCAAYNYLWSNGAFVDSISGLSGGTYGVTVIDNMGCAANDIAVIQEGLTPILDLGPDTVTCPGIPLLFSAPSNFSAYQWSNGSISQAIMMNGAGMYTCTVWSAQGCQVTDTVLLSEHVVDDNIITAQGSLTVCSNDTVVLVGDAGLSGYQWNTGQATQTIAITGIGGPIILAAVDGNGCATRDTVVVNIIPFNDPLPVIFPGPNAYICDSGSVVLDAGLGYFDYLWSNGDTTQTVAITQPGSYNVTVWNGFGCSATSNYVVVSMASSPNPTIVLNSGILTTTQPYAGYQWFVNGFQLPGANSQSFPVSVAGWYHVGVVDFTGCYGLSDSIYFSPVGVGETFEDLTGLTLYPNPSMGIVNLRTLSPIDWPIEIEIWDVVGQKVKSYNMAHLMDVAAFDLNDLAAAPYLMKITTFRQNKTHQAVIRFVIQ
ncbi:MAG: HYR domain-containing protein, partial [Bacteroidetes bacterium]|nr:HYR domain-containing protein [Bacteroidota bacterium]